MFGHGGSWRIMLHMLATIADLMDITGQSYTDDQVWNLNMLLGISTREIQIETGRLLERQVLVWQPTFAWNYKLPEPVRPVIISVKDSMNNDLSYTQIGVDKVYITNPSLINFELNVSPFYLANTTVTITYEAGYEIIPPDLKAICCQMVLRAYGADPLKSGMTQEAITNYSYQQGQAAAAGAIGMLPMEKSALRRYKRPVGSISMKGC